MMEARCIPLEAVSEPTVGGKAWGLSRLIRMGLAVPEGFVIVGAAADVFPADLDTQHQRLGAGPVAVRSSAIGEDSEGASFAGQYETVLNVQGADALREAIRKCAASLKSHRASAYRAEQLGDAGTQMNVVVQRMVDARAAGVLFTAHPVTGRRDVIVIDAVQGLGEALVSGHVTPDHFVLRRDGAVVERELEADVPVLSEDELRLLLRDALAAERHEGHPLDMEWAIDREGNIRWLQARPITNLPADIGELDTPAKPTDVFTWANIGEMMPGAVTPLTYSVTAVGVDVGMQRLYQKMGIDLPDIGQPRFVAMFFGHLFLNLSEMALMAGHVAGASKTDMCTAVCGRDIDEVSEPPRASKVVRALNGARYGRLLLSGKRSRERLSRLIEGLRFDLGDSAKDLYEQIDRQLEQVIRAYEYHLTSSVASGAVAPILLGILAGGDKPTQAHHAQVAALLAGATDVESADIAAGAERVVDALAQHPDAQMHFAERDNKAALHWIRSPDAREARDAFEAYLKRHGHRAVRELDLRQKEWSADPLPLIASLRSGLRARLAASGSGARSRADTGQSRMDAGDAEPLPFPLRRFIPLAHAAVRSREHTKSQLVKVTTAFKRAYRALGGAMVREGYLPDQDALFFLTHQELGHVLEGEHELVARTRTRRQAFAAQHKLSFEEVFVGRAEPLRQTPALSDEGALNGKPVSRGVVTGRARVVRSLEEASALEAGEILIAPITDVGWTPYFSMIAGLATDVGSAVSHGAVVAREYGLPAVVNLRTATTHFKTGDQVTLDGDTGTLKRN